MVVVEGTGDYYARRLSGERLRRVYELASPRVRRYLEAEIAYVLARTEPGSLVLELGCGYGRVLRPLAGRARLAVGVDTALDSLRLGIRFLSGTADTLLAASDAVRLGFPAARFDLVCCVQNGVSAFHVDRRALVEEAVRVTRSGGRVLFSTYAAAFWPHRLDWFRAQAAEGLVGEIDEERTGDGRIVCRDGFTASTVAPGELARLSAGLGSRVDVVEVDGSSVFCEVTV